jgi:hypothetical protein
LGLGWTQGITAAGNTVMDGHVAIRGGGCASGDHRDRGTVSLANAPGG